MSKEVTCINDKKLPEGANVVEGQKYHVDKVFTNNYGTTVYLLAGTINEGLTSRGLKWHGYDSARFRIEKKDKIEVEEYAFALN